MIIDDFRTRFAKAARVEDFNAKDISNPDRERTLLLLSAFINFIKFTEQYCDVFVKNLRNGSETVINERDQASAHFAGIQQQILEMKWVKLESNLHFVDSEQRQTR